MTGPHTSAGSESRSTDSSSVIQPIAIAVMNQSYKPAGLFDRFIRCSKTRWRIDAWGRVDIIVNNAGYTLDAPIHKMSDADFQAMVDIHTIVPFRVLRAAAPYLRGPAKRERAEGREVFRKVVNVASTSAYGNAGPRRPPARGRWRCRVPVLALERLRLRSGTQHRRRPPGRHERMTSADSTSEMDPAMESTSK
jgi:NAD(P)-dependent dehydrogenase (short-subunit alcohol dehydrogenase family)